MARITVEDCLKRVENRFLLVTIVAKRVRKIREGSELLVASNKKNEDVVTSLREVATGRVTATLKPKKAPKGQLSVGINSEAVPELSLPLVPPTQPEEKEPVEG